MQRKLYRSVDNRMMGGVAAGFAEYFRIDPSIARLLFVGLCFAGVGIPLYLISWIIVPKDPDPLGATHSGSGSLFILLFKALVLIACCAMISEICDTDFGLMAFGGGVIVGIVYLVRSIRGGSSSDDDDIETIESSGLYRSTSDKKIFGVFGGLAEMFKIDATILRVIGIVAMVAGFPLIVPLYLIYAFFVPERRRVIIL